MILESWPVWPTAVLAFVVFGDALLSIHPPKFIRKCLLGVNFPEDWWWFLVYIKIVATAGLAVGFWIPGVGIASNVGVVAYFIAACAAHFRARFLKSEFWINCLGMLGLSVASLVLTMAL